LGVCGHGSGGEEVTRDEYLKLLKTVVDCSDQLGYINNENDEQYMKDNKMLNEALEKLIKFYDEVTK